MSRSVRLPRALLLLSLTAVFLAACAPSPEKLCELSCAQDAECYPERFDQDGDEEACVAACRISAIVVEDAVSDECFNAQSNTLFCVAQLSCERLDDWAEGDPDGSYPYPCKAADNNTIDACSSGGSSGGSCDCSTVVRDCTITYNSLGQPTEHCTCSPSCCC